MSRCTKGCMPSTPPSADGRYRARRVVVDEGGVDDAEAAAPAPSCAPPGAGLGDRRAQMGAAQRPSRRHHPARQARRPRVGPHARPRDRSCMRIQVRANQATTTSVQSRGTGCPNPSQKHRWPPTPLGTRHACLPSTPPNGVFSWRYALFERTGGVHADNR
jgi:hypothetical protein